MTEPRPCDRFVEDDAQQLYDMAPCGFATVAWSGTVLNVNETFLAWTGYTRDQLVGVRTFADLLSRPAQVYDQTHLRPMLLMGGTMREISLDIRCADDTRLPVLMNATLQRDHAGEPELIRLAVFDARERRAYEQELFRAKERAEASEERARLLSRTLQQSFVPPSPPAVPGLEISAVYRPAGFGDEVGGDFYDVYQRRAGEWVVVIGDVTGKGVRAAVVTALVRYSLRAAVVEHETPSEALAVLNRIVTEHETDRFCTIVLLYLRRAGPSWEIDVCAAGHPAPVLVRAGGEPRTGSTTGSLVGVLDDPAFADTHLELAPGDLMVLYTDGVTEARRGDEFFGEDRMHASIAAHRTSAREAAEGLQADVVGFQGGSTRDDIAVVALRVPPDTGHAISAG